MEQAPNLRQVVVVERLPLAWQEVDLLVVMVAQGQHLPFQGFLLLTQVVAVARSQEAVQAVQAVLVVVALIPVAPTPEMETQQL